MFVSIVESNLFYIGFNCALQVSFIRFARFKNKINAVMMVGLLYVAVGYCMVFYVVVIWLYQEKKRKNIKKSMIKSYNVDTYSMSSNIK